MIDFHRLENDILKNLKDLEARVPYAQTVPSILALIHEVLKLKRTVANTTDKLLKPIAKNPGVAEFIEKLAEIKEKLTEIEDELKAEINPKEESPEEEAVEGKEAEAAEKAEESEEHEAHEYAEHGSDDHTEHDSREHSAHHHEHLSEESLKELAHDVSESLSGESTSQPHGSKDMIYEEKMGEKKLEGLTEKSKQKIRTKPLHPEDQSLPDLV